MKHVLVCGEYPPAPTGGIGTYAVNISRLLAEAGEIVHVICKKWEGAEESCCEDMHGRLIVHRVPFEDWAALRAHRPHHELRVGVEKLLFDSDFPPQCFAWSAAAVLERLVDQEGIDVVEAQEYEAPLYYFQLRRALDWGPQRRPPCVVHLHSPSEFIARHNNWDAGQPRAITAKRLEDYCIASADALLCPSSFLARQAERHYSLPSGAVSTISYPLGNASRISRDAATWEMGSVCFVGRLEPRKGVFEWVKAATEAARVRPETRFEFVGADTWIRGRSVREMLEQSIPRSLRRQFFFHGEQSRAALPSLLERARIGVVPSRWDNFPNACVELMASGVPVIATRDGGMAEMIVDGESGWLAWQPGANGLAEALARALDASPARLAEMGQRAGWQIRAMCDNDRIVEAQLEFRRRLVAGRAHRALHLPGASEVRANATARQTQHETSSSSARGIAVVLLGREGDRAVDQVQYDLDRQSRQPSASVMAARENALGRLRNTEPGEKKTSSLGEILERLVTSADPPLGVVLTPPGIRLEPKFIAAMESALQACPDVGVVSCWFAVDRRPARGWVRPNPSLPYQLFMNDAGPCPVYRTEALEELWPELAAGATLDGWALSNRVLAAGWLGMTAPALLARASKRAMSQSLPVNADALKHLLDLWKQAGPNFDAQPLRVEISSRSVRQSLAAAVDGFAAFRTLARNPRLTAAKLWRRVQIKARRRLGYRSVATDVPSGSAATLPRA